jgi:hypothetical protein
VTFIIVEFSVIQDWGGGWKIQGGLEKATTWKGDAIFYLLLITRQAYIQYMRFSRRAEGVKESRIVFKRGREDTRTNFHVSKFHIQI